MNVPATTSSLCSHEWRRWGLALCASLGLLGVGVRSAHAEASVQDRATAQALFEAGRELVQNDRLEEACEKFAASQKLDPAVGTQLNLADCYERTGKTASAWINYLEVAAKAGKAEKRGALAGERAAALKPKLCRLRVEVASRLPGLTIERDGEPLLAESWGTSIPVDPASYRIAASAPGRKPWQQAVEVTREGEETTVTVPELAVASEEGVEPPAQADDEAESGTAQLAAGSVIGILGLGGLGVATWLTVHAHGTYDDSLAFCPERPEECTAEGVELRDEAQTYQLAYTVAWAAGGALVLTGLVLLLTAPGGEEGAVEASETSLRVEPMAGPSAVGLALWGRW